MCQVIARFIWPAGCGGIIPMIEHTSHLLANSKHKKTLQLSVSKLHYFFRGVFLAIHFVALFGKRHNVFFRSSCKQNVGVPTSKTGGELFHNKLEPSPVSIISRETSFLQLPMTSVKKVQVALEFLLLRPGNWKFMKLGEKQFKICLVVLSFNYFRTFGSRMFFLECFFLSPSSWTRNLPGKKRNTNRSLQNKSPQEIPTQKGGLFECPERRCQNCFNFCWVPRWWRHCAKSGYKRCDISKCSFWYWLV